MKKILSIFTALLMILMTFSFPSYATDSDKVEMSVESKNVNPGEIFEISINLENNPGIVSANFNISFDDGLTLVGATNGDVFPAGMSFIPPKQLSTTGEITGNCNFAWSGTDIADKDIKDGTVLTLKFSVSDSAKIGDKFNISLSCRNGDVIDRDLNVLNIDSVTGQVLIVNSCETKISFDNVKVIPGKDVTVSLKISDNPGIVSANLNVAFDENLTLISATNGAVFPVSMSFIPPKQLLTTGEITGNCNFAWSGTDIADKDIKDGIILILKFRVSDSAKIDDIFNITVSARKGDIIDRNVDIIEIPVFTGSVEIIQCSHTGETEIKNAVSATCGKAGYTGDIYCKDCGTKISNGSTIQATGNHTWNNGVVTTAATCKSTGIKTYTCTVCQTTKTKVIAKNASNHTGGTEIRNAVNATCGKAGYTGDTYCKGCGVKLSNGSTIQATGNHTWNNGTVTTIPTCKNMGVKTYTCSVCSSTKTEAIAKDPNNHTGNSEVKNKVDATCGESGYTGDTYCNDCEKLIECGNTVNATDNHTWNSGVVTTSATCKNMGVKTYTCTVCQATKTEAIEKNTNNHIGGTEIRNKVSATCGKAGYTGDTFCKGCGVKLSNGSTIQATGNHSWNNGVVTTVSTCKTAGVKTYTCTVCSSTKTEVIAKNSDNHIGGTEIRNKVSATCGKAGYTGDTYCKGCGTKLSNGLTVDATGKHIWDNGIVTTVATCKSTGVKTYTCTVCSSTKMEIIVKNSDNHTGETEIKNVISATCGKDGYTGDTYCKDCGVKLSAGTTIKATGKHTWNNGVVTTVATCKSTGVKTYTCTVCSSTKTEVIAKNSSNHTGGTELKNVVNASCGKAGYTGDTYCKGCGAKLSVGTTIQATGKHNWNSGVVTTIPTCKATGVKTYTCTVCSSTKTETIAKTDSHTFGEWTVKTAATYEADGEEARTCSVCGKEETKAIAKLIAEKSTEDKSTGIEMNFAEGTFSESNVTLEVKTASKDTEVFKIVNNLKPDKNFEIFDISALSGETKVQPNGNVQISIPLSDKFDSENVSIYYVNDKGEMEKLQSYVKDGKIIFETNHFSYYVVVDETSPKLPDVTLGDINGDGKINTKDARAILRYSAKLDTFTNEQIVVADVNNDGKVNTKDARKVLRVAAKLEEM